MQFHVKETLSQAFSEDFWSNLKFYHTIFFKFCRKLFQGSLSVDVLKNEFKAVNFCFRSIRNVQICFQKTGTASFIINNGNCFTMKTIFQCWCGPMNLLEWVLEYLRAFPMGIWCGMSFKTLLYVFRNDL